MAGISVSRPSLFGLSLNLALLLSLTPGSYASYPPANTNCTATSVNSTSWEIRNFAFDTKLKLYYGQGTAGKVSFSIKNSANGYEFNCTQGNGPDVSSPNFSLKDGKVWYKCGSYCYGGDVNPPLDTSFNFDIDTKKLSVSQKWTCAGRNASVP